MINFVNDQVHVTILAEIFNRSLLTSKRVGVKCVNTLVQNYNKKLSLS